MTVVIDASVILKWVIPEADSEAADALLASELIAPSLWISESANALWRLTVQGTITKDVASKLLNALRDAPVTSVEPDGDIDSALALATDLNHPLYDCLYLALALRENTHVVTADKRFVALASKRAHLKGRVRALT